MMTCEKCAENGADYDYKDGEIIYNCEKCVGKKDEFVEAWNRRKDKSE